MEQNALLYLILSISWITLICITLVMRKKVAVFTESNPIKMTFWFQIPFPMSEKERKTRERLMIKLGFILLGWIALFFFGFTASHSGVYLPGIFVLSSFAIVPAAMFGPFWLMLKVDPPEFG